MRVAKDIQVDSLKSNQRDIMPVIDVAQYVPILGSIALNDPDDTPYYADGTQWLPFAAPAPPATTLTSAGGAETLVNDGAGPTLATKGLTAGAGISLTSTATEITIENTGGSGPITTLTSAGGVETLVNDGTGPTLATKGLTAGLGVSLTSTATEITISSFGSGTILGYSFQGVFAPDSFPFLDVPSGGTVLMNPSVSPPQIGFTNPLTGQIQCPATGYLLVDVNYTGVDLGVPTTTKSIGLFKVGDTLPIITSNSAAVYGNSSLPVYELSTSFPATAGDIFEIRAYSADNSAIRISCPLVSPNNQPLSWATFVLLA
jgi:hypothetical protein